MLELSKLHVIYIYACILPPPKKTTGGEGLSETANEVSYYCFFAALFYLLGLRGDNLSVSQPVSSHGTVSYHLDLTPSGLLKLK